MVAGSLRHRCALGLGAAFACSVSGASCQAPADAGDPAPSSNALAVGNEMAKVLERFGTWAERNSTRLHDAMMSFRSATPGQNDSVVDAREGSLGSSASERKEAMEEWTQWLRCNSPLTGA